MQTPTVPGDDAALSARAPTRPPGSEEVVEGVVLVADVAGFTRLTESLASSRPDGLEQVARRLEAAFADSFAIVERHGGRVSALAGDALVAVFVSPDRSLRQRAAAARDCAHDLVQGAPTASAPARPDADRLLLHVGLAHGPIWFGAVPEDGSGEQPERVVGGSPVREAFQAAKASRAGEAVMAAGFAELVAGPTPGPDGDSRPVAPRRELAPPGAPTPPTSAREPAPASWSAELRNVAALFIRLVGFDETRAGAWDHYRQALRWVHEVAGASKASGRLVVDELGLTLVIVFGEPTGLRAELPEQTVTLASQLVHRLERGGFSVKAGLAFGRAFCGYIGAERRLLVTVGPCMNLAARLMEQGNSASRSQLLVAGWPNARLGRAGLADGTAALELKGYGGLVEAIRLDRDKTLRSPTPVLFGRREELERIDHLMIRTRAGTGAAAVIRGDAGMGKSALLSAAMDQARERHQLPVFIGESREADHALPYQPWRRILRGLLPELADRSQGELRGALLEHLQAIGQPASLAPLLNGVFDAGIPETSHTEALAGKNRAEAILDLLFELVRQAIRGPAVLVFEDAHLADSPSVRLIDRVVHRLPSLLIILAARPSAQTSELIFRLSGARLEQLDLQPLTAEDISHLVRSRLPGGQVDDEVVRLIIQSAEGNALFAQEYLVLLQESGRIALGEGGWRLSADRELQRSPDTVLATVGSRIHALPVPEQILIKSAAVVGEGFSKEMLSRVRTPLPTANLETGLAHLERSGLITRTSSRGDSYRFSHAIIREAAYGLMLFEQKTALHADVGRILEERYRRDVNALLPALVHHFDGARDDERVVRFGDLAADEAMRQGAYREAIDFLRLCLDAVERVPAASPGLDPRVRWHRQMSEASAAMGELAGMRASAEAALRAAGERPRRSRFVAKLQTALVLLYRALPRRSVPTGRPRPAAYWPIERELAQVNHQLGISSYFRGERALMAYYYTRALLHAERGDAVVQQAYGQALAGGALCLLGFQAAGRRHLRQALVERRRDRRRAGFGLHPGGQRAPVRGPGELGGSAPAPG